MYACNAPFASAISVDWSFDWWSAYRFFAFQVQLISHPMMLTRRKKDLLLIEVLSAFVQVFEMPKNSATDWEVTRNDGTNHPHRRRRKERNTPTGSVLARPQRCLGAIGCGGWWWPTAEKMKQLEAKKRGFECLSFWGVFFEGSLEICHICGALCL